MSSAQRRTVATVATYEEAQLTVDYLSDQQFPVEHVAIVGTGLRYVEQVTGRVTTGKAALMGVATGGLIGLFWGALFGLFFTLDTGTYWGVVGYSVLVGVVFGAFIGAGAHAANRGRRDFSSSSQTRADRYEVQVDEGYADAAEKILATMPSVRATT
jgi:Heat induced stress protein YflT domain